MSEQVRVQVSWVGVDCTGAVRRVVRRRCIVHAATANLYAHVTVFVLCGHVSGCATTDVQKLACKLRKSVAGRVWLYSRNGLRRVRLLSWLGEWWRAGSTDGLRSSVMCDVCVVMAWLV